MGYKPSKKIYHMQFEDFPGLEVSCYGTSLGKLLKIASLDIKLNEPDEEKRMYAFHFFASRIATWNVEHPEVDEPTEENTCPECGLAEGTPLPTTVQGMMCLEMSFIMKILFGWMSTVASVSRPKEPSMSDGENNIEDVIQRLVNMQNLGTSFTPS